MNGSDAKMSLYVSELAEDVSEETLYSVFKETPIQSLRLIRDAANVSRGYGYVNFADHETAAKALDLYNFTKIDGKEIRIMWNIRDPSKRKSQVGNTYIGHLPVDCTARQVYDTFKAIGDILSCKFVKGKNYSHAFVQFTTAEAANVAVEKVNGVMMGGEPIIVSHYEKREHWTNVYLRDFPADATAEELQELLAKFGKVTPGGFYAPVTPEGKLVGFACANFENREVAQSAIDGLHEMELRGSKLYCVRALNKKERSIRQTKRRHELMQRSKYTNLYVKNFDENLTDAEFHAMFAVFGDIVSAVIKRDNGVSKGFGFVNYDKSEDANRAIAEMNNKVIAGNKTLYVALHQPAALRRQTLVQQHQAQTPYNMNGMPMTGMRPMMPYAGMPAYARPMAYPTRIPVQSATAANMPVAQPVAVAQPVMDNRQVLGEALYPNVLAVVNNDADLAGRITGMLLEFPEDRIRHLTADREELTAVVATAQTQLQA